MLIDVTKVLTQFDGMPLKDMVNGEAVDATVRMAFINALMAPAEKDSAVQKVAKYDLATRVYKQDKVEITVEEASLIKEAVGKSFAPIVVGQVYNLLDGKV
jgi:hypothetical protein